METLLEVKNLFKEYNPKQESKRVIAVNNISFSAHAGEILGILGPNGSGKTSTIKSIATVIDFEGGSIFVGGHDVRKKRSKVTPLVGAVLEGARNIYWTLNPMENLYYFAALKGLSAKSVRVKAEEFLHMLDLEAVAKKPVRTFSKGMQQKVAIACALIGDPELVLLDEPTLGLDVETARTMQTFIKQTAKEGKLVLITSHDMRFIERTCDRVLVIKQGQIIAQDTIQGLNAFFRKKVYKLRLQQPADTQMIVELGKVGHCRVQEEEDGLSLYYVLEKEQELYTIFDTLRRNNAGLLGLDVLQDDFEDIFLSILKNSSAKNGNAGAQA